MLTVAEPAGCAGAGLRVLIGLDLMRPCLKQSKRINKKNCLPQIHVVTLSEFLLAFLETKPYT